ncbi:ASML protein, partial [Polyodon spathula]|nr:ASML protein [Polyodon spathula]
MVLNPVITKLAGRLVVLASASPRRREVLTNVGLRFEVVPSWFKETLDKSSFAAPHLYAVETAKQKAVEVARRMQFKHLKTPDIVIGADTIVTIEGEILEKPADKQDAYKMLSRLSGKEHSVFTGVAIVYCNSKTDSQMEYDVFDFFEETKVKFADLSEELLWEYIHSGEPMDKAGGYGIQALGGMLVEYVHGDFLNVVGFPLNHFCKKLAEIYHPPPKSDILHTRKAIWIGNQLGDQDNRSISHHCAAVSVEASGSTAKGLMGFPPNIAALLDGFKASKTLFVASKLKVFDLLNCHGSLKVGEVADKLQTSVVGTERLLDGCVALCLLEKTYQLDSLVYKNTEQANMYLVSSSEYSLHGYIIYCNDHIWPLFTNLEHALQERTNQNERAMGSKTEDLFQDAYCNNKDVRLRFMNAMHSIARATGRDVAAVFDLSRFKTACDVGGCTGAMAYELVKMYPDLTIAVYDLPAVIEMSSHFRPHKQDTHRVTFTAGDFFKDDLPKADLYILSRILHDWSEDKIDVLLSKISQICTPGCGLLVAEIVLDEQQRNTARALLQALSMTEGKQRSGPEYNQLLQKYAFTEIQPKHTGNFLDAILFVKQ